MAHTIAFGAAKGGVGKSTCTCAVAAVLARSSMRRMLVLDAAEQRNSLRYLQECRERGYLGNVDCDTATASSLKRLASIEEGRLFSLIDLPGASRARELKVLLRGDSDVPGCDLLVVPMAPSDFDLEAVLDFVDEIVKPSGVPYGVVLSRVHPRSVNEASELQHQLQQDGVNVFDTLVRDYRGVRDAQRQRVPLTEHRGPHDTVRFAEDDFCSLTREILRRVGSRVYIPPRVDDAAE
ncbi:MAG: AAA family ATPase [Pseudonocardiaceae bacterium]|nr:AAA family ATPase [Pseudonocardiaceae bacterium]